VDELPAGWLEAAREPPPPADRAGDFDFWVGEWEFEPLWSLRDRRAAG
jgi:hypothetical protein